MNIIEIAGGVITIEMQPEDAMHLARACQRVLEMPYSGDEPSVSLPSRQKSPRTRDQDEGTPPHQAVRAGQEEVARLSFTHRYAHEKEPRAEGASR